MEEDEKAKKPTHRSPRYPGMGLSEAIERIRLVYSKEKRAATSRDVIAGQLGYSPGTGPANRVLSALRQYKLLEEKGGKYRVSDLAFNILHLSDESADKLAAIREAAQAPDIMREILSAFPDGMPSDATLGDFLLRRKFNPDSVSFLIKVLKETMDVAKLGPSEYTPDSMTTESPAAETRGSSRQIPYVRPDEVVQVVSPIGQEDLKARISPECVAYIQFRGRVTQRGIDKLIKQLQLSRDDYPEDGETGRSSDSGE